MSAPARQGQPTRRCGHRLPLGPVRPGDAFFCVPGFAHDGHDFAADAVARGASALVVERELELDVPQFVVDDSRVALAYASAEFYGSRARASTWSESPEPTARRRPRTWSTRSRVRRDTSPA